MPDESSNPGEIPTSIDSGRPEKRSKTESADTVAGVTGVVLAGGMSRRFGKNKALARIQGVPMIERVVLALEQVFEKVILCTNESEPYRFLGLPTVEDIHRGVGPLGGLHSGLSRMADDAGFFVACDMPLLEPGLIRYMAGLSPEADAVVPRIGPYVEPLHALYRRSCVEPVLRAIQAGERRIVSFYPAVKVLHVEESDLRAFDPGLKAFTDVNRPEELRLPMKHPDRHE